MRTKIRKSVRSFTLIEVLVSVALLLVILIALAQAMDSADRVWKSGATDPFSDAQDAFETVAGNLADATLETYEDYADVNGNFRTNTASAFAPDHLARRSDLAFACGPASNLLASSQLTTIGSAVFFTATEGSTQTYANNGLERLLNDMGFFVQFGDDASEPAFLASIVHRYRWRLCQIEQPSESLQVYSFTTSSAWIEQLVPPGAATPTLAENVIALIVLPERNASDSGSALSPAYSYDSRDATNPVTLNQLPPRLWLAMVAIDSASADRLAAQYGSSAPPLVPATLFQQSALLSQDLATLDAELTAQKIGHRIFQRVIQLPSSAWSNTLTPDWPAMKFSARNRRQESMVLVMALMAIAIITVLLVALFEGAVLQTRGAQSSAVVAQEQMLADTAVGLVEGQIEQASTNSGQAWMSQPGLVRTYSLTNAASPRAPTACYKLYSNPTLAAMTDTSGTVAFMASDVPANWASEPTLYTDLNTRAQTSSGEWIYPIFNPSATNTVQGVSIDNSNGAQMPVAWLYQLQDGTLGPASNATAANPIVARIAFWTDDDTGKININTAGCGASWNTPRVNSAADISAASEQPAQGEYSAYPGHPATTSLNVVFGSVGTAPSLAQEEQWLGLSPRYAVGGSQFGTQPTTPGETVPMKTGHLYASLDELLFAASATNSTPRTANAITPGQLEAARFVLTAHSVAPETTLLGEPRVAIWPVADSAAKTTATDRAIMTAATVGARDYFFQRNSPLNPLDDFDPSSPNAAPVSNLKLFQDLVNRGNLSLPGCSSTFAEKYSGAAWTQILLEIADYIHALNAVDPSGTPFAPWFTSGSTSIGYGFVEPLTTTCTVGTSTLTLRGLGRCPMLSSLTIVFYVSGFTTSTGTFDYESNPDTAAGASWNANFGPSSTQWTKLTGELVRAFVVPCTFQPGCGYPEVSEACKVQIQGLNNITVSAKTATGATKSGGFGFPSVATSLPLGTPLKNYSDRAWGGNEGPLVWTVTADALAQGQTASYAFAGTSAFVVPMASPTNPYGSSNPGVPGFWPDTKPPFTFSGATLTVLITDLNGNTLQTNTVTLPAFSVTQAPTMLGEADHADTIPSTPGWATNAACAVAPSWYMTLAHRLATSTSSRALMIQAGDVCRSVEAAGDWRVAAALPSVPAALFQTHPLYNSATANLQGGTQALNLRFADGTSPCFALGNIAPSNNITSACNELVAYAPYAVGTNTVPVHDWRTGTLLGTNSAQVMPYTSFTNAPCSIPTGTEGAFMSSGVSGDWDTGPGLAPDGAQINLPDAGTTNAASAAYFSLSGGAVGSPTQRTPNALVPSPVIFGSLPAGINPSSPASSVPWRTLLFCPYPAANTSATPCDPHLHPGAASPPDYLILDNFWMPVVEPYAISSCLATRGKVNLNDQIVPFTWLHRSTALRALLDDLSIPAIPATAASAYKTGGTGIASIWNPVDEDATVAQIENRFANGSADAYLSESEICAVPLVPKITPSLVGTSVAATQAALAAFWNTASSANANGQLTGDNLRELPYAQIYSRLTTRSNSYTVHIWVQVLKKITTDPNQNVWNPATDIVLGEWRGSYEIERYLNPAAVAPAAGSPLGPYNFRIVSKRRFAP